MIDRLLHTPEGVRDIYNAECAKKLRLEKHLHQVLKLYGFQDIQTPTFEYFDIFRKERGTVAAQDMYRFFDREGNTLVLRPDLTPSIARCVAKYFKEEVLPIRLSYRGTTFINNSEYQGKLKESTQFGVELINDGSVEADAEIISLTIECLKSAGMKEFQVEIGQVEFFKALAEEAELSEQETEQLRELIENKNSFGMQELIVEKKLTPELQEVFQRLPELFGQIEQLGTFKKLTKNKRALKSIERLEQLFELLKLYGLEQYITFDLGMLSKYGYYTGMIFQAYTHGTGDKIISGGRYDGLVGQFGKAAPAIGMAIFVDQMMLALSRQKLEKPLEPLNHLVLYPKRLFRESLSFVRELRGKGIRTESMQVNENEISQVYYQHALQHGISHIYRMGDEGVLEILDVKTGKRSMEGSYKCSQQA